MLNLKNRTGYEYFSSTLRGRSADLQVGASESAASDSRGPGGPRSEAIPLLRNYFFSALAGTCWYFQFFFYTMGETQMGRYGFASWTLHMASIIIFSTIWGWIFHEWKGSSRRAHG